MDASRKQAVRHLLSVALDASVYERRPNRPHLSEGRLFDPVTPSLQKVKQADAEDALRARIRRRVTLDRFLVGRHGSRSWRSWSAQRASPAHEWLQKNSPATTLRVGCISHFLTTNVDPQ